MGKVINLVFVLLMLAVSTGHAWAGEYDRFFQEIEDDQVAAEQVVMANPNRSIDDIIAEVRRTRPKFSGNLVGVTLPGYVLYAQAHQGGDISLNRYREEEARQAADRAKRQVTLQVVILTGIGLGMAAAIYGVWRIRNRIVRLGRLGRSLVAVWILWPLASVFVQGTFTIDLDDGQILAIVLFPPAFLTVAGWLFAWVVRAGASGVSDIARLPSTTSPSLASPSSMAAESTWLDRLLDATAPAWLMRIGMIVGAVLRVFVFIFGLALVKYAGIALLVGPVAFGGAAYLALRWSRLEIREFRWSFSLMAAHMGGMLAGIVMFLVAGQDLDLATPFEVGLVLGVILWLLLRPSWQPALLLVVYEMAAIVVNVNTANSTFDPSTEKALVVLITIRVAAVLFLLGNMVTRRERCRAMKDVARHDEEALV